MSKPILISHHLCPYVQRAVIALTEKGIDFEKKLIDLSNKPDWFLEISPTGKVPVLQTTDGVIFESSVIVEYIEEITNRPLHPASPFERAQHRAWMEFGSGVLSDISGLYSALDKDTFEQKAATLRNKFETLEVKLEEAPYFAGETFSLVDAVFGPIFRYFDAFEHLANISLLEDLPKIDIWRKALSERPSVQSAVAQSYQEHLRDFLVRKSSYLSKQMAA